MPISVLRAVTTFDAVVDTDLGLVRLILDEFNNPDFLIPGIDKLANDLTSLRVLLADREVENPLSVVYIKDLAEEFDSLREQFFDNYYERILTLSGETSVSRLLCTATKTNAMVQGNILCKNELEYEWIKKLDNKLVPMIVSTGALVSSGFSVFYLKRGSDISLFEPIRAKNIMIMEYRYNLEMSSEGSLVPGLVPKDEYLKFIGGYNGVYTIPVYPGLELPPE